ncbi:MAG: 4Fe-4S binding protein [Ruminococcus sp.]|nr:4Fe-4S binding protein [Ruminococcus sp.]
MEKKKLTPLQIRKIHKRVRAVIQIIFFLILPATFSSAFNGVKYIFTQIGSGSNVQLTSFVVDLLIVGIFTIIFGRFFCGFACAFGSFGDAVHAAYVFICKKLKKKPIKLNEKLCKVLTYLKYLVLLTIIILCFLGYYTNLRGTSPWDVFSMLRSGNFMLAGYAIGIVLLVLIVAGMAVCERFFCRFLCPMGAVFSLLASLPLTSITRKRESCIKGCKACKMNCPASLDIAERGSFDVNGDCFQCGRCVDFCPKKNIKTGGSPLRGSEVWFMIVRAVILAAVLLLGAYYIS